MGVKESSCEVALLAEMADKGNNGSSIKRVLHCKHQELLTLYPCTIQQTGNENTQMYQVEVVILI